MRHSFRPCQPAATQATASEAAQEASNLPDGKAAAQPPSVASSSSSSYAATGMAEPSVSKPSNAVQGLHSQPANPLKHNASFNFGQGMHVMSAQKSNGSAKHAQHGTGPAPAGSSAVHLRVSTGQRSSQAEPAPASYASSNTSATSAEDMAELHSRRVSGDGASTSGQSPSSGWHPHDPEHLIVNGLGGAFLHPTHVFSPSRFVSGQCAPSHVLVHLQHW